MGLTLVTVQQCIKFILHFESHYLPLKSLPLGLELGAGQLPAESLSRAPWEKAAVGQEQRESPATWKMELRSSGIACVPRPCCPAVVPLPRALHHSTPGSEVTGMADGAWAPKSQRWEFKS